MKRTALLFVVCAATSLLSSCFFSPCSGCGHNHASAGHEQVRPVM